MLLLVLFSIIIWPLHCVLLVGPYHFPLTVLLSWHGGDCRNRELHLYSSHLGMFESLSSQYIQCLALYYHTVGGDESVALSQQSISRPLGRWACLSLQRHNLLSHSCCWWCHWMRRGWWGLFWQVERLLGICNVHLEFHHLRWWHD